MSPGARRWTLALRVLVSAGLLALLVWALDPREIVDRLLGLKPGWALAALALSVVQVALSAWRWRFTALRVGLELPPGAALGEYYLATFLNQVLPGGVVGDVSRAWRHARDGAGGSAGAPVTARAVHAVLVERASGQVVMLAVALLSAAVLLVPAPGLLVAGGAALALAIVLGALRRALRRRAAAAEPGSFLHSLDRALLEAGALRLQMVSSAAVVGSYLITFVFAARALGVTTELSLLLTLVAPVLVTMLLPVTVAGWGLREAAAAALWSAVGLTSADGVAISVTYGVLVLLGSTPGALVPLFRRRGRTGPDRRRDRSPDARGAPEGEAPRPASRWPAG